MTTATDSLNKIVTEAAAAHAAGRPMNLRGRLRVALKVRRLTPKQAEFADQLEAALADLGNPDQCPDLHAATALLALADVSILSRKPRRVAGTAP